MFESVESEHQRHLKATFTPRYHVAHGMPRDTPLENEQTETYETFHTEVTWQVAFATCVLRGTSKLDLPVFL